MIKSLNKLEIEEKSLNWLKGIYKSTALWSTTQISMGGEVSFIHVNNSMEKLLCGEWQEHTPIRVGRCGVKASMFVYIYFV